MGGERWAAPRRSDPLSSYWDSAGADEKTVMPELVITCRRYA